MDKPWLFQSGNPGGPGRPALPSDINELKKLNRVELERTLNKFLQLTREQLKKVNNDPESTTLELFVCALIAQGINKGDPVRLDFLLNRLIGKVKDQIEQHIAVDNQVHITWQVVNSDKKKADFYDP